MRRRPGGGEPPRETALHLAAKEGHSAIVELLSDKAAQPGAAQSGTALKTDNAAYGIALHSALHSAAQAGHVAVVEILLHKAADINSRDHAENTSLMTAAIKARTDVVEFLLGRGADMDSTSTLPLCACSALALAIGWGHITTATMLLEEGADPNGRFHHSVQSTLLLAVSRNKKCPASEEY